VRHRRAPHAAPSAGRPTRVGASSVGVVPALGSVLAWAAQAGAEPQATQGTQATGATQADGPASAGSFFRLGLEDQPLHTVEALGPTGAVVAGAIKVLLVFTVVMVVVAFLTLLERRLSAWIQDRMGPNRVGPYGILQPLADGLKNILKEETDPRAAARVYFFLAPALSIVPALITFAVVPFAAPLATPWGLVDMIVADVPVGILYILAISSLGVYGLVMAGWASNSKYAFLGGLRAAAQMVSYEVALGMSLIPIFMLVGNVTLPQIVWAQQEAYSLWFALPLGLAFFLFVIAAFAETNRLPFDVPEAEAELVTGYHTEYSSMKFSMFFIAEYSNMLTAAALMATLFLGGWDVPFWQGDDMLVIAPGVVAGAAPAWWKTLLTLGAFVAKTALFIGVFMWVRWTLPRFRYDQVMHLGWKVLLPTALAYITLVGTTILVLDAVGLETGFVYGLVLTAVNLAATIVFLFWLDNDRVIGGASYREPAARAPVGVVYERVEPARPRERRRATPL
ncbi:MAG: NADH-quinone oxidoreductase subunit NuoH, partial [Longimicrobiales bacterium]